MKIPKDKIDMQGEHEFMSTSDLLTIISIAVSVIIAIVGGLYAISNNTKRFELSEQYKKELLTRYGIIDKKCRAV